MTFLCCTGSRPIFCSSSGLKSRGSYRRRFLSLCASYLLHPRLLLFFSLILLATITFMMFWNYRITSIISTTTTAERNYGVVIDAGSSSSKIHLFQWPPHDGDPSKLLTIKPVTDELGDPRMKKVEPGIATFARSPDTAFTSIQPLLEFALNYIPSSRHQHTSLYIFCTAGMRLLPKQDQERIVDVLYEKVSKKYPFFLPKDGVQVISGKLEGVFSWISLNYLLGQLSPGHQHGMDKSVPPLSSTPLEVEVSGTEEEVSQIKTVGCLDMGGASLQVAFEISPDVKISPDYTVDINLGCGISGPQGSQHKHRIFVSTYLGYGTNEARTRYYEHLLSTHLEKSNQSHFDSNVHLHSIRDPCAPLESLENISIRGHTLKIRGLGDFRGCKKALLLLMQNTSSTTDKGSGQESQSQAPCKESDRNCSHILTFQRPPFPFKYESLDFYGTSEFWYTMRDVLRIEGHYTAYSYERAAIDYCQTNWKVLLNRFKRNLYLYANYYRLKSQCMKSAWLSLILHEGLGFPRDTISLHSAASIDGQSVQWALGALLYNTRFLPLREVQLHQLKSPPTTSHWEVPYLSSFIHSSFLLPFLMVLSVALLLLCCRHRTRPHPNPQDTTGSTHDGLHHSQSLNTMLKLHRRTSSMMGSGIHIDMLDISDTAGKGRTLGDVTGGLGASGTTGFEFNKEDRNWSSNRLKFTI